MLSPWCFAFFCLVLVYIGARGRKFRSSSLCPSIQPLSHLPRFQQWPFLILKLAGQEPNMGLPMLKSQYTRLCGLQQTTNFSPQPHLTTLSFMWLKD